MGVFELKTIVNVSRTSVVRTCLTSDFIMDRTAAANGCMMSRWRGNMGTVAPMPVPANRWRFAVGIPTLFMVLSRPDDDVVVSKVSDEWD
jgi:hypothetical protein